MHGCINQIPTKFIPRLIMARITITLPDNLHNQVTNLAGKEKDSISYTSTRLIEIGLLVTQNKNTSSDNNKTQEIEEYCQKLIIQINGILKEIAIEKFNFDNEKIAYITNETLNKFKKLRE